MRLVQGRARAARRTFGVLGVLNERGMLNAPGLLSLLSLLKRDRRLTDKTNCMRHRPDKIPVAIMDK
ncbi:MAG TPA: hypothetical protein VFE81_21755, partial [Paraburkholderia sp.]|nr:hypothetical protein [Paraburkholderia sp.]